MTDTTTVVAVPSDRTTNFDWGAIIGGALIATALSFVLVRLRLRGRRCIRLSLQLEQSRPA